MTDRITDNLLKERFKNYSTDELVTFYRYAQEGVAVQVNYASLIHRAIALRGRSPLRAMIEDSGGRYGTKTEEERAL